MSAGAIEQGIPGGVDGTAAERLTGLAGEPLEYIPDHRNDPVAELERRRLLA